MYLDGSDLHLVKSAIAFVRISLGSETLRRQEVRELAPVAVLSVFLMFLMRAG